MITEEMLISAAGEVSDAMVGTIPVQPHRFSAGFERKLRSVMRRAEHPVLHRVMRQTAAILMVVFTCFAMLYVASPTARATATNWIRDTFGSYFQYSPIDTSPADTEYDYFLPEEFEGYSLMSTATRGDSIMFIYSKEDGQMLTFDYVRGSSDSSLFVFDIEDSEHHRAYVGSLTADIYIPNEQGKSSIIIWQDSNENVLFCIQAVAEMDKLISFAEKVEKIPKN